MVIFETPVNSVSTTELQRFVARARVLAGVSGPVDVLISGNPRLKDLNRRFRRKNKPTDVLSFPRPEGGDIAISADIALENARRYGHGATEELKILILHGILHLAGYDHEADNGRMAAREARLRAKLNLPASLIDRAHSPDGRAKESAGVGQTSRRAKGRKPAAHKPALRKRRSRP